MPRFKYWVIVMDAVPTAFRAGDAAELLPTLRQLQRRHPQATMKWFERERYWDSPEDALKAMRARRPGNPARPTSAGQWRPRDDRNRPTGERRQHDRPRGTFPAKGGPRRGGPRKPRRRD